MKIIIAYASAGGGHTKAAEAIYNYFKSQGNVEIKLVDILENSNPFFKDAYIHGYSFLVNYLPLVWSLSFYLTYSAKFRKFSKWLASVLDIANTRGFRRFLIEENPDYIICTHFSPPHVASFLKKSKKITSKIIAVITDFGVHPFWISESTDIYAVASDYTREKLLLEGIEEQRIKVIGIPIDTKFSLIYDKLNLCSKFGMQPDKFTVLITTGSFGMGPIEEIVDLLYKDVQIIVVCAHNKSLYQRLKQRNYASLFVFGFVNNIEELMAISDTIIAKPGGLTISESLSMELPLIFVTAIAGQETENIKFLSSYNVGTCLENAEDIKNTILEFKNNPSKIQATKESIRKIKKPNAVKDLYNVIR